jgi:hypothetical protein
MVILGDGRLSTPLRPVVTHKSGRSRNCSIGHRRLFVGTNYRTISSARNSSDGGTVSPRSLAVLTFTSR